MSAVLVTGAAGFAGSHLLDALQADGAEIIGWKRPGTPPPQTTAACRWMDVELLDSAAVADALADARPSAIYHLAGAANVAQSWRDTHETFAGNVLATRHLIAALVAAGLQPRVLVACSANVYAPSDAPLHEGSPVAPRSPYAVSKLAQETGALRAWQLDAIPTIVVRAFNHIGPRQAPAFVAASIARQVALIEAGRLEPVLTMGNLEPRRDLTDVRDTVQAYRLLMTHGQPGGIYNVCSGRALAIGRLVEVFCTRARTEVRLVQDPARFRPNDLMFLVGNHDRLTRETGWRPQMALEETVDDLLDYWRDRVARGLEGRDTKRE